MNQNLPHHKIILILLYLMNQAKLKGLIFTFYPIYNQFKVIHKLYVIAHTINYILNLCKCLPLTIIAQKKWTELASQVGFEEMAYFLDGLGLNDAAEELRTYEMNDETLIVADDQRLKDDYHVKKAIDRLRFRVLFRRKLAGNIPKLAQKFTPEKVASFVGNLKQKTVAKHAERFFTLGIDGEMLLLADAQVFKEDLEITYLGMGHLLEHFKKEIVMYL